MNAIEVNAAIKQCIRDAKGDNFVYWEGEEQDGWIPAGSSVILLSVTTLVTESDPRVEEDDSGQTPATSLSTPYVFTIRLRCEDIRNDGSAWHALTRTFSRLELPTYRQAWYANGIAIVDRPLSPVNLSRTVDGRTLANVAADVRIRAVLTDSIALSSGQIETVEGEGTLTPGDIPVPFEASS